MKGPAARDSLHRVQKILQWPSPGETRMDRGYSRTSPTNPSAFSRVDGEERICRLVATRTKPVMAKSHNPKDFSFEHISSRQEDAAWWCAWPAKCSATRKLTSTSSIFAVDDVEQ